MPIYETARNKVAWANHHILEIESRIDGLKKNLVVTAHVDANAGCEFIQCAFAEPTEFTFVDELALRLGDAIHNLKCALDHAWFQTVTRLIPTGDWRRAKFPVYPTPDGLKNALVKLEIDIPTPNFFKFLIGEIQPYDGGNFSIRPVHLLNRRDKHSLLIPVVHYSSIGDIYVKDQRGELQKGQTWATDQPLPHRVTFPPGFHIEKPGSATFNVMFKYGSAGNETRMVDTLRVYLRDVLMIVKLLEKFRE